MVDWNINFKILLKLIKIFEKNERFNLIYI